MGDRTEGGTRPRGVEDQEVTGPERSLRVLGGGSVGGSVRGVIRAGSRLVPDGGPARRIL